jgi:hypothetical protein
MSAPVVDKLRQGHARSCDSGGARGLAHKCAGSHATPVKATRSGPREGPSPDTTLHCVGARGPDVAKVRSLTVLCGLQIKVVTGNAPKGPLQYKRCQCFGHTQRNCGMHLGVWPAVTSNYLGSVSLQRSSLSAAPAEETTLKTIVVCSKWKEAMAVAAAKGKAAERMASTRACQRSNQLQLSFHLNRRNLAMAETTLSEAAASSRLMLRPILHQLHLTQEDRPRGRLPQRVVKVSQLVLKCRWWNPSHPIPNRPTQNPLSHRVSLHSRGSPISSRTLTLKPT